MRHKVKSDSFPMVLLTFTTNQHAWTGRLGKTKQYVHVHVPMHGPVCMYFKSGAGGDCTMSCT